MDVIVICTTCQQERRFGKLLSHYPGDGEDNTFHCPDCHGTDFDVSHLETGREAA